MKLSSLALPVFLFASLVSAQPAAPEKHVTALGVGELQVAPDIARVTVEAVNNDDSPVDAAMDTRKDMATILAATRRFVRNPADLKTTRLNISPEYEWIEGKRKFRGYSASQGIEITIRDLSKVDSLLGDLVKSKLTTLGNLEFSHSKSDSIQREALAWATFNARANAARICATLSMTCDEVLAVRMAGTSGPSPVAYAERAMMKSDAGTGIPVQAGVLTFTATVEADYKLK